MTDIVERLRDMSVTVDQGPLRLQAADEIERLRRALEAVRELALAGFRGGIDEDHALSEINNTVVAALAATQESKL